VFTSPSTEQVYRIARAASGGGGILLSFGNYAGDRLNFGAAKERLIAEGIDTRIVYVTDDIASAVPEEKDKRRGIAGTFSVYKIGGAAADRGADLNSVERIMTAANDATYSFGVAFGGCTFPGQHDSLFTVDRGQMEFGLGIHGEPGVRSAAWMPAPKLAAALVEAVLAERPENADDRAAVVLNGLGASKYEELFLLYGHVARLFQEAGVTPVMPEVGELVTSLDMAGCSLSVTWLDDELEALWTAPADTPAFRRGDISELPTFEAAASSSDSEEAAAVEEEGSEESLAAAAVARDAIRAMTEVVLANEKHLGQIDAVAGDGDHGIGMARGSRAALAASERSAGGVGSVFAAAGDAFGDKAGGTSGILWGILLSAIGASLGNSEAVSSSRLRRAVRLGADTVQKVGKAELGDKTLLDALMPFLDDLDGRTAAGEPLALAWAGAAETAVAAAAATADLVARIGRARPLGERSVGTPDPGATSMALILTAVGTVLAAAPCDHHTD